MSAIVKGRASAVVTSYRMEYDSASGDYVRVVSYAGSERAISGLTTAAARSTSHSINVQDGHGFAEFRTPMEKDASDVEIRYEIATEVVEKEIWEHPDIIEAAENYNNLSLDSSDSFKEACIAAAATRVATPGLGVVGSQVIQMIRNGITGWEYEYPVIRRTRRVPNVSSKSAPTLVASIGEVQYVYTTGQLLLPGTIAFQVPDSTTLAQRNVGSMWGWRRRPSNVVYDTQWVEQSGEFVLAEWDTLLYTAALGDAGW